MILIDANIWIYTLDHGTPEHEAAARAVMAIEDSDGEILLPAVVQLEVVHYLRRYLGPGADEAVATIIEFPAHRRALDRYVIRGGDHKVNTSRFGIGLRDGALLHHAMQDRAILWTHDSALLQAARQIGVQAVDPITPDFEAKIPRKRKTLKRTDRPKD